MTILTSFSEAEFEQVAGAPIKGEEEAQVSMFIDFVQEAIQFCMVQADIEETGCSLRYLSIDIHPFKDMGDLYDLAYIDFETILELPEKTKDRLKIELPIIEEGVGRISEVAKILGVPSTEPADAILAFFRIRLAHKMLENTLDFESIKTVIRGTKDSMAILKKKGLHPTNMGGILDSVETVRMSEVWGLEDDAPEEMPQFFVFE
tara:strand:- start:1704 stop:2318 length:615 start_codon:yes stop_codon:yes gene_type:complete